MPCCRCQGRSCSRQSRELIHGLQTKHFQGSFLRYVCAPRTELQIKTNRERLGCRPSEEHTFVLGHTRLLWQSHGTECKVRRPAPVGHATPRSRHVLYSKYVLYMFTCSQYTSRQTARKVPSIYDSTFCFATPDRQYASHRSTAYRLRLISVTYIRNSLTAYGIVVVVVSSSSSSFNRRCNPWWVLAWFTISFHNLLSLHFSLQFLTFIFFNPYPANVQNRVSS